MSRRKVLFWDFDGTLGYRPGGWSGAIVEALAEHEPDLGVTREEISPYLKTGFPWQTPERPHLHLCEPDLWWQELAKVFTHAFAGLGLDLSRAQHIADRVRPHYLNGASWTRYEDTIPALRRLSRFGWTNIVISNHVPELPDIVARLGMHPYIDQVITSAAVGYEKPHPHIFKRALELVGQTDAVWMIGDNYDVDVLGAEAVGLRGILVRTNHPGARYSCQGLDEVVSLVEKE